MERPERLRGWTDDASNPEDLRLGFSPEHVRLAKAVVVDALLSQVVASGASRATALHARQRTVATAVSYFWRFYQRRSFTTDEPVLVAVACLSLAGKTLENPVHDHTKFLKLVKSLRNSLADAVAAETYDESSASREELFSFSCASDALLPCELRVLDALKFDLTPYDPHKELEEALRDEDEEKNQLFRVAWGVLNDSLVTPTCVCVTERAAAVAAVAVACELMDVEPPKGAFLSRDGKNVFVETLEGQVALAAREMTRYRAAFAENADSFAAEKKNAETEKNTPKGAPAGWRARPPMLAGLRARAARIIEAARRAGETAARRRA